MMTGRALILGGSGRFGRNMAEALWNAGWQVRLFDRTQDDLDRAAQGCDVIVHGWNPAYNLWEKEVPRLTEQVIGAAKASGATVLVPGNVYVFGQDAPEIWSPETPHAARNPLGRIRTRMEAAFRASGVRTILLRAGDFIDTEPSGNWFDMVMTAKLDKSRFVYPGDVNVPHAWAYLPDLAATAVRVLNRRDALPRYADLCFPGYTLTGAELHRAVCAALGTQIALKPMAWWPLTLARPVWPLAKPLLEMRYLWNKAHRLDGSALEAVLGHVPQTPLPEALSRALAHVPNASQAPRKPRPTPSTQWAA